MAQPDRLFRAWMRGPMAAGLLAVLAGCQTPDSGGAAGTPVSELAGFAAGAELLVDTPQTVNPWNLSFRTEEGARVMQLGARYGDCIGNNSDRGYQDNCELVQRFEVQTRKVYRRGQTFRFSYDIRIPTDFPFYGIPVVQQVKLRKGSKAIGSLDHTCGLSDRGLACFGATLVPPENFGQWVPLAFEVTLSNQEDGGSLKAWANGEQLADVTRATLKQGADGARVKIGFYHPQIGMHETVEEREQLQRLEYRNMRFE